MSIVHLAWAASAPAIPPREGTAPPRLSAHWSLNPATGRLECAWVRAPGPLQAAAVAQDCPRRLALPEAA